MKKSPNYKRYTAQRPVWMNECLLWKASTRARGSEPEEQYAATCDAVHTLSDIKPDSGTIIFQTSLGAWPEPRLGRKRLFVQMLLGSIWFVFFTAPDQIWSSPLSSCNYYTPLTFTIPQPQPESISNRILVHTFTRLMSSQPGFHPYFLFSFSFFCFLVVWYKSQRRPGGLQGFQVCEGKEKQKTNRHSKAANRNPRKTKQPNSRT